MPSLPAVVDFSMVKNKAAESVTEYSSNCVWCVNGGSGNVNNGDNKTCANKVRVVCGGDDTSWEDVHQQQDAGAPD